MNHGIQGHPYSIDLSQPALLRSKQESPVSSVDLAPDDVPGRPLVPDHDLLRVIGKGAYGEVWLARSIVGTLRAVKIVSRHQFDNQQPYEREFNGIKKFEPVSRAHEGLVDVLQIGRNDDLGYFYYVMELADNAGEEQEARADRESPLAPGVRREGAGASLETQPNSRQNYSPRTLGSELRRHGRLPIEDCVRVGLALTSALEHLHQNGLVHRDIKPSNIIFVNGAPKLADIGLVAAMSEAKSLVGTPGYIPPEGAGTPQADLYSLGKVLYEMATGRDRTDFPQLPPDLSAFSNTTALVELNEILLRACDPTPTRRYASAASMCCDLQALDRGRSIKRLRRLNYLWGLAKRVCVGIVILAALGALSLFFSSRLRDTELHSPVPKVNDLVKEGNYCLLSETPDGLPQAYQYFTEAIRLDPKFVPAYFGLFQVRFAQNSALVSVSPDAAHNLRAVKDQLMSIAPEYAEAYIADALLTSADGDARKARDELRKALHMRAASRETAGMGHSLYGFFLLESGDADGALREFQLSADNLSVRYPSTQASLGLPYFLKGDFTNALWHFRASTRMEPRYSLGYSWAGRVFEEQGNFIKAIDEFEKCDLAQGHDQTRTKLFYDDLRRAVDQDPVHGYWWKRLRIEFAQPKTNAYQVATLYLHLGDKPKAYEWLARVTPDNAYGKLWVDPCWNQKDTEYLAFATRFGLKP